MTKRAAKTTHIKAYGSLCDFLASKKSQDKNQHCSTVFRFDVRQLAKDAIESSGIPHPEVDLLLINRQPARFDQELRDGDLIEVAPAKHPLVNRYESLVRPAPLAEPRFLVDENSLKLANRLLILGFDTSFDTAWDDPELARRSAEENRILLTRDIGLLKRGNVVHGHWLRSSDPYQQVLEVMKLYDLLPMIKPFSRCLECNDELKDVDRAQVNGRVPPATLDTFDEFFECQECDRVFWKGSHFDRMQSWIERLKIDLSRASECCAHAQANRDPTSELV